MSYFQNIMSVFKTFKKRIIQTYVVIKGDNPYYHIYQSPIPFKKGSKEHQIIRFLITEMDRDIRNKRPKWFMRLLRYWYETKFSKFTTQLYEKWTDRQFIYQFETDLDNTFIKIEGKFNDKYRKLADDIETMVSQSKQENSLIS